MRWLPGTLLAAVLLSACSPPDTIPDAKTFSAARTAPPSPSTNQVTLPPRYPDINPVTPVQGRVTFVNERLRFVIVDFAFHQMPRFEQRLGVYRRGVRMGEVRISGPVDGSTVVADVMSGEANLGDQVREDTP